MKRLTLLCALLAGCASQSVLPEKDDVKVSRETPSDKCENIGPMTGQTMSTKGKPEDALEDLKQSAVNRGANYVKIEQYSDLGTSVTGVGFRCP